MSTTMKLTLTLDKTRYMCYEIPGEVVFRITRPVEKIYTELVAGEYVLIAKDSKRWHFLANNTTPYRFTYDEMEAILSFISDN